MNTIPNITVQLVHMQGPLKGEIQELSDSEIRVGRHPDCQVQFPKELVTLSRVHARIVREGNRFKLIDQSTNGTYVNGQQVKEAFLKDGDVVMFAEGGPKLSFLTQISDARTAPSPEPRPAPSPTASPPSQSSTPPQQQMQPPPRPAEQPSQPPPVSSAPQPKPEPAQTPRPLQAQPASAPSPPPVETVKAPFAIQFGPALKSFQTLPITIGSGAGCDFIISHPGIYEQHAQIFFSRNRYWIKDLTGMNCITVGGMPIDVQMGLEPDMHLSLSEQGPKFRFLGGGRLAEVEDPLPAPPPAQPANQQPSPGKGQDQQERSGKLGQKAGGLLKKFFS